MKFKEFTSSHRTKINENQYPILIKNIKNLYKNDVKIWVSQKSDTNELFLDIEGEPQFFESTIDSFIKAVKDAKKHIQKND